MSDDTLASRLSHENIRRAWYVNSNFEDRVFHVRLEKVDQSTSKPLTVR